MFRTALVVGLTTLVSAQTCPEIVTACQAKTNVADKLLCFAQPLAMDCVVGLLDDSAQTLVDCAKDATTLCADSEDTLSFCLENNFMLLSPACADHVNPHADPIDAGSTDVDLPVDVDPVDPAVDPVQPEHNHHHRGDTEDNEDLKEDHERRSSHHSSFSSWKNVFAFVAIVVVFTCCVRRCRKRRMQRMQECERRRAAAVPQQPIMVVASSAAPAHAVYPSAPIPYATLVQKPLQSVPMQTMQPARQQQPSNNMYPSLEQRHFYGLLNQA